MNSYFQYNVNQRKNDRVGCKMNDCEDWLKLWYAMLDLDV